MPSLIPTPTPVLTPLPPTQVPMARASILWLIGEYCEHVPRIAPDVLRKMAKSFTAEEDIVKLQVINLAAKLYLTNSKQVLIERCPSKPSGPQKRPRWCSVGSHQVGMNLSTSLFLSVFSFCIFINVYWSIVDTQCHVRFCCTAQ